MSLRTKFILVFLAISIIPLLLATGAGYYHITKINQFASIQAEQSLRSSAEVLVEQKAEDIMKMIQLYFQTQITRKTRGKVNWDEWQYDPVLLQNGVQTVGKTGYSFLLMKEGGKITYFLHPNPKLVGTELTSMAKKNPDFWRIVQGPKSGERFSRGYYFWKEPDGRIERKFMVVMPIPNTPLMVATAIYTKEIEAPLKELKSILVSTQKRFLWEFFLGGIVTIVIVISLAIVFAMRMTKPVLHLTDVANRISLGELNVPIEITSTDEIGDLADALRRMQVSLRKAIQRLQRRTTL
ncbi:MAG: HAMP domain protein [Candidatus Methanoperedenaceae archaeon GB50]|nr:HAMP domain protein [Candidatus Methanoperedenaceae archaeon GB50]CAD7770406.1 HAMP domain protein [Candidatus Methanoperedenaceae archaeon GB37]CAD7777871.1 MAG: HAMP domain protein [Candidatus Methanoperedenaceae archaeon GB50]CAD7781989.1 MAG: HAMP domain protein [Candidatus Methanoperedenaceae archaeon GB37]